MFALAAVYVVVLQALLLPLSVAAGSPFLGPLCVSSASEPAGQPAGHASGCACAAGCGMQCCGFGLAAPAPVFSERAPAKFYAQPAPPAPVGVERTPIRSPLIPRAPPAA